MVRFSPVIVVPRRSRPSVSSSLMKESSSKLSGLSASKRIWTGYYARLETDPEVLAAFRPKR